MSEPANRKVIDSPPTPEELIHAAIICERLSDYIDTEHSIYIKQSLMLLATSLTLKEWAKQRLVEQEKP